MDERDIRRSCVRFVNAISQSFEPKVDGIAAFMAFGLVLVVGILLVGVFVGETAAGVAAGMVAVIAAAIFGSIRADRDYRRWRYKCFFRETFLPESEKRDISVTRLVEVMSRINVDDGALDERLRGMAKALPVLRELLLEQARSQERASTATAARRACPCIQPAPSFAPIFLHRPVAPSS